MKNYTLIYSPKRRSLVISVKDSKVQVRAPLGLSQSFIAQFVVSREGWISEQQDLQKQKSAEVPQRLYESGESFPFLGKDKKLVVGNANQSGICLVGDAISVQLAKRANLEVALRHWYRQQAEICLKDKTAFFAEKLNVEVTSIHFRITKTKWGHCTRDGRIQYNWLIILAPEPVIDYLVAHEVSHRVHLNHSPAFWQVVERLCPDYRTHRAWLKRHGHTLVL